MPQQFTYEELMENPELAQQQPQGAADFSDPQFEDYARQTIRPRASIVDELNRKYKQDVYGGPKAGKMRKVLGGIFEGLTTLGGGGRAAYTDKYTEPMMKESQAAASQKINELRNQFTYQQALKALAQKDEALKLVEGNKRDMAAEKAEVEREKLAQRKIKDLLDIQVKQRQNKIVEDLNAGKIDLLKAQTALAEMNARYHGLTGDPRFALMLSQMDDEGARKEVEKAFLGVEAAKGLGRGQGQGSMSVSSGSDIASWNPVEQRTEIFRGQPRTNMRIPLRGGMGNLPSTIQFGGVDLPLRNQGAAPSLPGGIPGMGSSPQVPQLPGPQAQTITPQVPGGPQPSMVLPRGNYKDPKTAAAMQDRAEAFQGVNDMDKRAAQMWQDKTLQNVVGPLNSTVGKFGRTWFTDPGDSQRYMDQMFDTVFTKEAYNYLTEKSGKQFSINELNLIKGWFPQKGGLNAAPDKALMGALVIAMLEKARQARVKRGYLDAQAANLDFSGAALKAADRLRREIMAGKQLPDEAFDPRRMPEFQGQWGRLGMQNGVVGSTPTPRPPSAQDPMEDFRRKLRGLAGIK